MTIMEELIWEKRPLSEWLLIYQALEKPGPAHDELYYEVKVIIRKMQHYDMELTDEVTLRKYCSYDAYYNYLDIVQEVLKEKPACETR